MTGGRSHDQLVDAAVWLLVQGDRAGAEELLARVLREDPTHERARQAMKSAGHPTSPGTLPPQRPIPNKTQPVVPPGVYTGAPTPAPQSAPPGLTRKTTMPGVPPPVPSSPSAFEKPAAEKTDRHLSLVPTKNQTASSTHPELKPIGADAPTPSTGKSWSLEVLTGPHAGTSLPLAKRALVIGRGLGVLDVDEDPFMAAGHASFFQRNGELWVSDGGSASGTWVSFEGPQRLNTGDSFSLGLQRLRYLGPLDTAPVDSPWPYGAPRPAASWRLEHVLLGGRPARTWLLRGVVTIGRRGSQLAFDEDETMEDFHAELRPAGTALELVDRSKGHTTFVGLTPSSERRLPEGTRVRLGSTLFRVAAR